MAQDDNDLAAHPEGMAGAAFHACQTCLGSVSGGRERDWPWPDQFWCVWLTAALPCMDCWPLQTWPT